MILWQYPSCLYYTYEYICTFGTGLRFSRLTLIRPRGLGGGLADAGVDAAPHALEEAEVLVVALADAAIVVAVVHHDALLGPDDADAIEGPGALLLRAVALRRRRRRRRLLRRRRRRGRLVTRKQHRSYMHSITSLICIHGQGEAAKPVIAVALFPSVASLDHTMGQHSSSQLPTR